MTDPKRYQAYLDLVSGRRRGAGAAVLRGLLRVGAGPYALAAGLRNWAYGCGLRRVAKIDAPVVSVGNITAGGTGKTPLVQWLARRLRERGVRVAVLSRGYGARALPEDRADVAGNDETDMLAANLPDVPQLVDPDRVASARIAVGELGMQCLILDDGFQHRRLARDLDIVTIDALNPFGYRHLLPRGLLREPVRSLRRAHVIVLTRCDQSDGVPDLHRRIARIAPDAAVVESRHAPVDLVDAHDASEPLDRLRGCRIVAVCGIGNPEGFRRTLADCGADIAAFLAFPDHHAYTPDDRRTVYETAAEAGAEAVVTTQKDLAKLVAGTPPPRTTRALRVELEVTAGGGLLDDHLRGIIGGVGA